jgi:hypothetical protein
MVIGSDASRLGAITFGISSLAGGHTLPAIKTPPATKKSSDANAVLLAMLAHGSGNGWILRQNRDRLGRVA